jgi:hypothetical protein
VAVVHTPVKTKQIGINIYKNETIQKKHSTHNKIHSKYKYTYYQNTHTLQNKLKHSTRYTPNETVITQSSTITVRSP